MKRLLRKPNNRRGAATVEFALLAPLVMLLIFGLIEFAMIGHDKMGLSQAARSGAREASIGKPVAAVRAAVRNSAPNQQIQDSQIEVLYNAAEDGSGDWVEVSDTNDGSANAVPFGRLVRVRVAGWEHQMLSGKFLDWLPGVRDSKLPLNTEMVMRRE